MPLAISLILVSINSSKRLTDFASATRFEPLQRAAAGAAKRTGNKLDDKIDKRRRHDFLRFLLSWTLFPHKANSPLTIVCAGEH
jgi:hypothetical protein